MTPALPIDPRTEWLETDGLGGFASGTSAGIATRRYHALLLVAKTPPADRFVLVNGVVAWLETPQGRLALSRHHYAPGVTSDAQLEIESFESEPWPCTRYVARGAAAGALRLTQEIVVEHGQPLVLVRFALETPASGVRLRLRPLLSGRDYHALHHENPAFRFEPQRDVFAAAERLEWQPYPGVPSVVLCANAAYHHAPEWYRQFRYQEEQARGLDCDEDLATPGVLEFDLSAGPALLFLSTNTAEAPHLDAAALAPRAEALLARERARRASFREPLARAAAAYVVKRGNGRTLIAGYPWFSDWGRDTFIALRGIGLASEDYTLARDILVEWSGAVSDGMLPNRFPDRSDQAPEYNSVDGSLWYVIAASEMLAGARGRAALSDGDRAALRDAILAIVSGYARGTRFGIRRDRDGLLAAGEPGTQLTWMDAKVGDYVVTPRIGKPVEVQALWINALHAAAELSAEFAPWLAAARASFETRFWNEAASALFDVIDVDHVPNTADPSLRPNQIFAAGGLPFALLSPERARRVVDSVERQLLTPLGLRSLARDHLAYRAHYQGGVWDRDTAYHQGTVWPWLMGPFVEAWLRTRGDTAEAQREARGRFLAPLHEHLHRAGVGHISEIADGDPPFTPRGCPFQAWSLSELIRLERRIPSTTP